MSDEAKTSISAQDVAAGINTQVSDTSTATVRDVVVHAPAVVLSESDNVSYSALTNGAAYFDLAPRHVSVFTGEKAAEALNGLVTNDVLALPVGKGLYAAALTPKGKMLADISVLRTEPQTFLVETSEAAGREWWTMVRKYVNPRLAKYKDDSAAYATIGVYGPSAPAAIARLGTGGLGDQSVTDAMEQAFLSWPHWAHAPFVLSGVHTRLVRAPYLGHVAGFEILVPLAARNEVLKNLARVGVAAGSEQVWQLAQLEGGRPVLGLDMEESTIPQEANLDTWGAISYEKGCYTGQETVARIHFRGHVNKQLRGLKSEGVAFAPGSPVSLNGKSVGAVRRSGLSPRLGPIAIAMIRREVPLGAHVQVGLENDAVPAEVVELPFAVAGLGGDAKRGAS